MTSGDENQDELATLGAEGQGLGNCPHLATAEQDPQYVQPEAVVTADQEPAQCIVPLPLSKVMVNGDPAIHKLVICQGVTTGQCNEGLMCPCPHGKSHEECESLQKMCVSSSGSKPAAVAAVSGVYRPPPFGMFYMESVSKREQGSTARPLYQRQPYLYGKTYNWIFPFPYLAYVSPYNHHVDGALTTESSTVMYNGMLWNKQALQAMGAVWWPYGTPQGIPSSETNSDGRKRRVPQKTNRKRKDPADSPRLKTIPEELSKSRSSSSLSVPEQGTSTNRRASDRNRNAVVGNTPPRSRQQNSTPKGVVTTKVPEPQPVFSKGEEDQWPAPGKDDKDNIKAKVDHMKPPAKLKDHKKKSPCKANKDESKSPRAKASTSGEGPKLSYRDMMLKSKERN